VRENMAAGLGAWPDEAQRRLMRAHTEKML
jgi:hypothetical protein